MVSRQKLRVLFSFSMTAMLILPTLAHAQPKAKLKAQCTDGVGEACYKLAVGDRNGNAALKLLTRGCKAKHPRSCLELGLRYHKDKKAKQAAQHFRAGCDLNDYGACTLLGSMLLDGYGVKQSAKNAAKRLSKACSGGHAMGCTALAKLYAAGNGVSKDKKRAKRYAAEGCKKGAQQACKLLKRLNR